jgi:Glycosyl hydrolase family 3 N terminal domain
MISTREVPACVEHPRRDVHRIDTIDRVSEFAGDHTRTASGVQDRTQPRLVINQLQKNLESFRRIRRPVPIRCDHTGVPEDAGMLGSKLTWLRARHIIMLPLNFTRDAVLDSIRAAHRRTCPRFAVAYDARRENRTPGLAVERRRVGAIGKHSRPQPDARRGSRACHCCGSCRHRRRLDFAPCIAVPQNERWGRTYEGFGETPELAVPLQLRSDLLAPYRFTYCWSSERLIR